MMTTTEGVDAIPHESEGPPFHGIVPGVFESEGELMVFERECELMVFERECELLVCLL